MRWRDRRNASPSGSALRPVRTPSAQSRRNLWNGSSESGTSRDGPKASASRRQWRISPRICGAGAAISASAKRPGCWSLSPLGPVATAGRSLAPVENTTAPPGGTCRKRGLAMGCKEHGRPWPRPLVSRPKQSPLNRALKCGLQIVRSPILVRSLLPQLLESPRYGPVCQVVWEARSREAPPIPINPQSKEASSLNVQCSPCFASALSTAALGRLTHLFHHSNNWSGAPRMRKVGHPRR